MSCQIRRNNVDEYENLIKKVSKLEILFAENVLLKEKFIECCHHIQDIEIYGSKISKEHDESLTLLLLTNQSLTKLELNCTITSSGFLSTIHNTNIQELYITHLIFSHKMVETLCSGIEGSKLRTLDLSYNDFDTVSFSKLCHSFRKTAIKFLFLCCCNITTERSHSLFRILSSSLIQYMDLFQNDIQDEGIKYLCSVLEFTKMKFLDIGKNNLSDDSCFEIAKVLPKTKLQHLWVNDSDITNIGIEYIHAIIRKTYITNFQYPLRLMNRFHFVPIFYENRKKIKRYNQTVHFRNFLSLMENRNVFQPEVLFVRDLSEMIMTFL